ncbi:MAG TPA: hypothetical protein VL463_27385 [Kofleriaceae bacterium]|nr:hypothetical protein [Kofleriaceae bacterium]
MRFVVLVTLTGCTVAANRVALVPHATPLTTTGQPLGASAAFTAGATNAFDVAKPQLGNPEVGLEIPSAQAHGDLAFRLTRNFSMSLSYDRGLHQGATPLKWTQPPVDGGDAEGYGVGFAYSIETDEPGLRVGIGTQLTAWNVPYTEYRACISGCDFDGIPVEYSDVVTGTDDVGGLAIAIVPSYHTGKWTYFGGLTGANHPTLIEKGIESSLDVGGKVQGGPFNLIAHAGVAVELVDGVSASAYVAQDLVRDPVAYRPSVGVLLSVPLGRDPAPDPDGL